MLTNHKKININWDSLKKTIVNGKKNPKIKSSNTFKYLPKIILTKLLK